MSFRVMSFNVRMDTQKDGDNRWDCRKEVVAEIIRRYRPAVFGLQEPHKHQVEWLAEALPEYGWVGHGRNPVVFGIGEEHCEYNPVFYNKELIDLGEHSTLWLSDLPMVPASKFSGAAFPRIATWAKLTHKESGRNFTFVCTHFDHEGEEPRVKSAQLLVQTLLPELSNNGPLVLVGDLNAGRESECYRILAGALTDAACAEGCCLAEGLLPNGTSTFCGFNDDINSVIDFIFMKGFLVQSFGVVPDKCPSGACPSDHKPIVADLTAV